MVTEKKLLLAKIMKTGSNWSLRLLPWVMGISYYATMYVRGYRGFNLAGAMLREVTCLLKLGLINRGKNNRTQFKMFQHDLIDTFKNANVSSKAFSYIVIRKSPNLIWVSSHPTQVQMLANISQFTYFSLSRWDLNMLLLSGFLDFGIICIIM